MRHSLIIFVSFEAFSTILGSAHLPENVEVQFLLSDRPENDFVTLASKIESFESDVLSSNESGRSTPIFTAMIPRSFYQQVVPSGCVDIGFSFSCLHHLEHVPPRDDGVSATDASRLAVLQKQSHKDLKCFLAHRAAEIPVGGSLILAFVSQASSGEQNYAGPVDSCRAALVEMLKEEVIPTKVATEFEVPTYNRTLEDVENIRIETQGTWVAKEIFEKCIPHPAVEELANRSATRSNCKATDEDSIWYANTVIDWLMAVISGYFLKAVKVGLGLKYTEERGRMLLDEWAKRTKKQFFENHRDEEVKCWCIYLRLERT